MKRNTLLNLAVAFALLMVGGSQAKAQAIVADSVTLGASYANDIYYSLSTGQKTAASNTNWDLAFQNAGNEATVLVNHAKGHVLYRTNTSVDDWATLDTTGQLTRANLQYNDNRDWYRGAFSLSEDVDNFDLGWGIYNPTTHRVTGDSVYVLKLASGDYKKIYIERLQSGVYTFVHANLDGTNEVTSTVTKANFPGQNFCYFDLGAGQDVQREPNTNEWDLVFLKYVHNYLDVPASSNTKYYPVTGVLTNKGVQVATVYNNNQLTDTTGLAFSLETNAIGFGWKKFDQAANPPRWTLSDTTVYFVKSKSGAVWKLVFTAFGGSSTGKVNFSKQLVAGTTSVDEASYVDAFAVASNPNNGNFNLLYSLRGTVADGTLRVLDVTGRVVYEQTLTGNAGFYQVPVELAGQLTNGLYHVVAIFGGQQSVAKVLVTQ